MTSSPYGSATKALKSFNELYERLAPQGYFAPRADDAERSVLGAMIFDKSAAESALEVIGQRTLENSPFYSENHSIIYLAMMNLQKRGVQIDMLTLVNRLREKGNLERIGGAAYLVELSGATVTTVYLQQHCKIILEKYLARQVIAKCEEAKLMLYDKHEDVFGLTDQLEQDLYALKDSNQTTEFSTIEEAALLLEESFHGIPDLALPGMPSGMKELDERLGGLRAPRYYVLGARPSTGKSAMSVSWALFGAQYDERPKGTFLWSGEMGKEDTTTRILANLSGVDSEVISRNHLTDEQRGRLNRAKEKLHGMPIIIDDTPNITPTQLRSKVRRAMRQFPIHVVVVDFIQLMDSDTKEPDLTRRVTSISRSLRALTKELGVAVLALSALNRGASDAKDEARYRKPMISELRESGQIESDADVVLLLWRKELYQGMTRVPITVIIGKQRLGRSGDEFVVSFDLETSRFEDGLMFPTFSDEHTIYVGEQVPF